MTGPKPKLNNPANYRGEDPQVAKGQARADACIREIGRLKAEGRSTLTAQDRLELQEAVVAWDNAYDALDKEGLLAVVTDDVTKPLRDARLLAEPVPGFRPAQ